MGVNNNTNSNKVKLIPQQYLNLCVWYYSFIISDKKAIVNIKNLHIIQKSEWLMWNTKKNPVSRKQFWNSNIVHVINHK